MFFINGILFSKKQDSGRIIIQFKFLVGYPVGKISIPESEIKFNAIRASGPGGQHVNKVSTAVQLSFDITNSSLSKVLKNKLLDHPDKRIAKDGTITLKAQRYRSQDRNKQDAIMRLEQLLTKVAAHKKKRVATKPSTAEKEKRLKEKKQTGEKKKRRLSVRSPDHE